MSSSAHILLKKGMMTHAENEIQDNDFIDLLWTVGTNSWVMCGLFLHVGALVVWLWALSKVEISFAYPFLALGYVLVSSIAWLWLDEELGLMKILGMIVIIIGISIISKST